MYQAYIYSRESYMCGIYMYVTKPEHSDMGLMLSDQVSSEDTITVVSLTTKVLPPFPL